MSLMDALLLDSYPLDVVIATRADGVLGSGTEDDPFDGSRIGPPSIPITSITSGGTTTATVTTGVAHGFTTGNLVQVQGATQDATGYDAKYYNGIFSITYVSPNQFTYTMSGMPAGPAFGQLSCSLDPYLIVTITASGTAATADSTPTPHGFNTGDIVLITGATGTDGSYYNGTFMVTYKTSTQFTYTMWGMGPPHSAASGTITCQRDPYRFDALMRAVPIVVKSITSNGTIATVFASYHGFATGNLVSITGASPAGYNGTFSITWVDVNQFTYPSAQSGSASGAIVCRLVGPVTVPLQINSPVRVRLEPGTIQTKGFTGNAAASWIPRSGMKIVGSGAGITTLKLTGAVIDGSGYNAISCQYYEYTDSLEIADFTIDCNIAGQLTQNPACGAIYAVGKHTRIKRIRAINFGAQTNVECFPISAAGGNPGLLDLALECFDCVVADCVLEQPGLNSTNMGTLIAMIAQEGSQMAYYRACVIRNCFADCEYRQNPVPIATISFSPGTGDATVNTNLPHGHSSGDCVRIAGALVGGSTNNSFNGTYPITNYISSTSFSYKPNPAPGINNPTGDMWVGRFSGQYVEISRIDGPAGGPYVVKTLTPHFLAPGQTVLITGPPSPFNGQFQVMNVNDSSGNPSYQYFQIHVSSVNPGPGGTTGYIGIYFQGPSAGAGRATVIEGNRIVNLRTGGPYADTYSGREILVRNNYYRAVVVGPYLNLPGSQSTGYGASLSWSAPPPNQPPMATVTTSSAHGFNPGDAVNISGATNFIGYNGNFTITAVPTSTSFQYGLANPGGSDTGLYARIWQVDWEAIENNIIELVPALTISDTPCSILFGYAKYLAPSLFPQLVMRRNSIRNVDGLPDRGGGYPPANGISVGGCGGLIVEENVEDLTRTNPIEFNSAPPNLVSCGATEFFANQSSAGVLVQGYNSVTSAAVDELSTNVQDAALLAF